jgi:lipopolysaccharide biosynthesis glycosyltransferase
MGEPEQTRVTDRELRSADLPQCYEMEVLCSCDERYLPHAATMLCSLLEHNSVSRIHLFYCSVSHHELAELKYLIATYGSVMVCYEMAAREFLDVRVDKWRSTSSIANYFRLLAPRILPANIQKILYLDSDIIVRRSLRDLWSTDLSDHALAAVEDSFCVPGAGYVELPSGAKYFNAGVLLVNLDY